MDMFDLSDRPRAWIEIAWPGIKPGDDDKLGEEVEHKIEMLIEIVDRDEVKRLFPRLMGDDVSPEPTELEILTRVASDWRQAGSRKKVLDKGKEVPFNAKNAAKLIKIPMFGGSFTARYIAALGGKVKLREGNSESLPGAGQADEPQAPPTTTSSAEIASD